MTGFLEDPPDPGRRSTMVESLFEGLVDLMRSCHERETGFAQEGTTDSQPEQGNTTSPNVSFAKQVCSLECPSLSLRHEGHLHMDKGSHQQAQLEAAALLTRPLQVEEEDSLPETATSCSLRMQDLPRILMNNIYESFAILVDSRLRVYAKVFFRHLTTLVAKQADAYGILQMGQKLDTLHDIGGQITAQSVQLQWDLDDQDVEETSPGVYRQSFRMEASMKLLVPNPTGQNRTFAVRHHVNGHFKAVENQQTKKFRVTVQLDTKDLLNNMMDQASLMVAQIVEATNEAFAVPEPKLERGESFLVMPPPMPRREKMPAAGLDLLVEATEAKERAVITPDLTAKAADMDTVSHLQLHEDENEANVDDLSVDQCASIIDDVFGGMDDALLHGPPHKKIKTSE